jgi:hypothetical protein
MTPKEKAKDLIDKFSTRLKVLHELEGWLIHVDSSKAKGHALIAVDELIKATVPLSSTYFWEEVKQEIEKI